MHGDSLLMLTTKVVSNKKPPLLSDSESGGSTSLLQDKHLSFAPYNITKEMIKEAIDMLEALKHKKTF